MTYNQLKLPWMIAHRIEWLVVYEIAIARAEPKLAPYFALPRERPFICFVLGGGAPQQPIDDARFSARRGRTNAFAVENGQRSIGGFAKPQGIVEHRVEHRREVAG